MTTSTILLLSRTRRMTSTKMKTLDLSHHQCKDRNLRYTRKNKHRRNEFLTTIEEGRVATRYVTRVWPPCWATLPGRGWAGQHHSIEAVVLLQVFVQLHGIVLGGERHLENLMRTLSAPSLHFRTISRLDINVLPHDLVEVDDHPGHVVPSPEKLPHFRSKFQTRSRTRPPFVVIFL